MTGDGPSFAIETRKPAMQRVDAVIRGQLKMLAIEFERRIRDPVGIAPDGSAEKAP